MKAFEKYLYSIWACRSPLVCTRRGTQHYKYRTRLPAKFKHPYTASFDDMIENSHEAM